MSESEYPEGVDPNQIPPELREAIKNDPTAKVVKVPAGAAAKPPGTSSRTTSDAGMPSKKDSPSRSGQESKKKAISIKDNNSENKPPKMVGASSENYKIPDSDVFVNNKNLQYISIYYKANPNGGMKVVENIDMIPEKQRDAFTELKFGVLRLNWALYTKLHADSLVDAGLPTERIDWNLHKKNKLIGIIKTWNAKDSTGNIIDLKPEAIMRLHPMIGETLLKKYDKINLLGEDEQGK